MFFRVRPTQKKTRFGTLYLKTCVICKEICYFQRGIEVCDDCNPGSMKDREDRLIQAEICRVVVGRDNFAREPVQ